MSKKKKKQKVNIIDIRHFMERMLFVLFVLAATMINHETHPIDRALMFVAMLIGGVGFPLYGLYIDKKHLKK